MPSRPTLLFILSLPVGAVVYSIAAGVIQSVFPTEPILALLIPLFVAGLAMMPLIIPFFDQKAKADLAEYRRQQAAAGPATPDASEPTDVAVADPPEAADGAVASEPHETGGTDR